MTLKHINFSDSPVMRELERRAVKQGTFQPQVEEIVKQAALTPKYAASGNLYNDMFAVAKGLRQLGFEKEANSLEEKILICKQAETHLYRAIDEDGEDVLEFAHPDGDTHIADAKDNHGEVETGLSAHQKIIEMLSKQPTGKTAQVLSGVRSILKGAQAAPDMELPDEIALDETQLKKAGAINNYLAQNWPMIGQQVKAALATTANLSFSDSSLLATQEGNYVNFFAEKAKVPATELTSFIKTWNSLYSGAKEASFIVIQSKLAGLKREEMYKLAASIDPALAKTYFSGVAWPKADEQTYYEYVRKYPQNFNNSNSVFQMKSGINWSEIFLIGDHYVLNEAALGAAAQKLHQAMLSKYDSLITSKMAEANKAVAAEISTAVMPLTTMLAGDGNVTLSTPPKVKNSTGAVSSALASYSDILNQFMPSGESGKNLNTVFENMTPKGSQNSGIFFSHLADAQRAVQGISEFLALPENILNKQDVIPSKETYAAIANNFRIAARRLNAHIGKLKDEGMNEKSKEFVKYYNRLRRAAATYKTISTATGKPYSAVSETVAKLFPKATTPELLLQESQTWLKGTEPLEVKSQANVTRVKVADYGDDEGGKAPAKAPAAGTQAPAANANTNVSLTSGERDAVQSMQLALFTLGQYLNTYGATKLPGLGEQAKSLAVTLMKTGKGINAKATKNQFDGAWGANTANALRAAMTVLAANPKMAGGQLQPGPLLGRGKQAVDAANSNTAAINQFITGTFGSGTQAQETAAGQNLDSLPKVNGLLAYPADTIGFLDNKQGVALTEGNLSSLSEFYKFLTTTGLVAADVAGGSDTSIGQEGFSLGKWSEIFNWFKKRAVFRYNAFKAQKDLQDNAQVAKVYYSAVTKLESHLNGLYNAMRATFANMPQEQQLAYVIPVEMLSHMDNRMSQQAGRMGRGQGRGQGRGSGTTNQTGGQYAGWQGGVQEGRTVTAPPTQTEGSPVGERLNLEQLGILDDSIVYPIISFNQFRANAIDLANSLINEAEAGMPAVNKFQRFLVGLYSAIQSAAAEWSRGGQATEEEVEAASKWSNAWAQMIRKKLDQIKRWRASGGR
jgi:cob(I)alamin adenosyltransferase